MLLYIEINAAHCQEVLSLSQYSSILWSNHDGSEVIEFVFGYYKLFSNHQMIPVGKTVEEVRIKLAKMGRNDIVKMLNKAVQFQGLRKQEVTYV